eukprot:5631581-Prymnesium_polylepis.1
MCSSADVSDQFRRDRPDTNFDHVLSWYPRPRRAGQVWRTVAHTDLSGCQHAYTHDSRSSWHVCFTTERYSSRHAVGRRS